MLRGEWEEEGGGEGDDAEAAWSSPCLYVGMCRMGDLEANDMSLESSVMLVLYNG